MKILNEIHFGNVRGDLFGGVTAAIIALPMALAFGVASGAGAEAGLYGAILVGLFAALFGGSPALISEPTGPMTVVMTAVIAHLIAADPENGLAMAFTVVILAGGFQILFGVLRLGQYVTLMPYTVISGFMTGIGVILIVLQSAPLLGHSTPSGGVLAAMQSLPELIRNIQPYEAALGLMTLVILFVTPRQVKRYLPPQLIALILGTVISLTLIADMEMRRIGEIPAGLPSLQMPVFSAEQWRLMIIDALVLGMLGCIDALLTSVIADNLTKQQHNSDKELIGQGAGATMGTVVNIQAGGRTALSGITRALILLVVVVWAADLTASIPLAVLAGIAIKVGIDIIDWGFLKRAHRVSGKGALIMYGVILLTVFVDLITAVGIGLFVANVITIRRMSELQASGLRGVRSHKDTSIPLIPEERELLRLANERIMLFHLNGPMIFGLAKAIARKSIEIENCDAIILDFGAVPHMGVSSSLALEEMIEENVKAGRDVYIVGAQGQTWKRLEDLGVTAVVPAANILNNRARALRSALEHIEQKQPAQDATNNMASAN
ncbi:MAG: Bicarbonate transporter BicA [Gammaproteobacteria bacterium SG8_15]|nr:MAG: Bicarbonate transporter BicA [Gammaproteobacteria bacterium SG8_15]